jgi:hypothetical protein
MHIYAVLICFKMETWVNKNVTAISIATQANNYSDMWLAHFSAKVLIDINGHTDDAFIAVKCRVKLHFFILRINLKCLT